MAGIWLFPVKSMRGKRLEQADATERGLVSDRAYRLIDSDTGNVVSAKSARLFPCAGAYAMVETPGRIRIGDRMAVT